MQNLEGKRAGKYLLRQMVGRGGMGAVFVAQHMEVGRVVAVKVMAPPLARGEEMAGRFRREARSAGQIRHPNVIEVYDYGDMEDGTPFFAMELLEGHDLRRELKGGDRLNPVQLGAYLKQICAGLQAAHDHGVVHRDLKPANIFVLEGAPLRIKIVDFGIAKVTETPDDAVVTAAETFLGDPTYVAPEQAARRHDEISPQTDIYALGVLLYEALAGKPPFEARTVGMLLAKQINDPPPPIRTLNPDLSQELADLVHACLAKDPGDRPASAAALAASYEDLIGFPTISSIADLKAYIAARKQLHGEARQQRAAAGGGSDPAPRRPPPRVPAPVAAAGEAPAAPRATPPGPAPKKRELNIRYPKPASPPPPPEPAEEVRVTTMQVPLISKDGGPPEPLEDDAQDTVQEIPLIKKPPPGGGGGG